MALKKRAIGYESSEITEEYQTNAEGEIKMVKRKVVSKLVPPDVSAVKLLIGLSQADCNYKNLSDAELEAEKQRLLKILLEEDYENNCGEIENSL